VTGFTFYPEDQAALCVDDRHHRQAAKTESALDTVRIVVFFPRMQI